MEDSIAYLVGEVGNTDTANVYGGHDRQELVSWNLAKFCT